MSRKRIVSHFERLAAILALFSALALLNGSWVVSLASAADLLSVNRFLNSDGTLNLASAPHGTFNLRGWNVTLDTARGPILAPAGSGAHAPAAVGDWSALGSNGSGNGSLNRYVYALAVRGSDLYVGGNFTNVSNSGTTLGAADFIAKWDGTNWSALGSNGSGDGSLNSTVYALAVNGSDLYVGGEFTNVNNGGTTLGAADFIAKWDGTNWSALGSDSWGDGSLNSFVYALAVRGSDLYVGGEFTNVNNGGTTLGAADFIAKWDGTNWSALGSDGGRPGDGSLNSTVYALTVSGSDLYVGGEFTNVNNGGTPLGAADFIAKWDGTSWSALGSGSPGDGSLNSFVYALAMRGSDLYVGGLFTNVNNGLVGQDAADFIAKWDGTKWSALGSNGGRPGNGSLNSVVYALAVSGSDLYVGGVFTDVNNGGTTLTAADYIAKWDGTNWSALGSDGSRGGSLKDPVNALAVSGSDLYVGGYFYDVNNGGTTLGAADFVAKHEINVPTAADLAAFTARVNPQQDVVVRWRTGNEMNLVGFNVYRATNKNGIYKQLNKELIAAKHPGGILGANYSHANKRVKAGKTYFYKLEIVRANGASEWSAVRRVKIP